MLLVMSTSLYALVVVTSPLYVPYTIFSLSKDVSYHLQPTVNPLPNASNIVQSIITNSGTQT